MNTMEERESLIVKEMSSILEWEDRYMKIIDYGKSLDSMDEKLKTEDNKIKGCQSQVWLHAELTADGLVRIVGDSDALIVKGLVALILKIFSFSTPAEILQNDLKFLKQIGLDQHLSPSRSNGVQAMIKQIKMYAFAFDYLIKSKK